MLLVPSCGSLYIKCTKISTQTNKRIVIGNLFIFLYESSVKKKRKKKTTIFEGNKVLL